MKELIDRKTLLKQIKTAEMFNDPDCPKWVLNIINNMTAIETRPADVEMEYWSNGIH